jgi:hypothetical protein
MRQWHTCAIMAAKADGGRVNPRLGARGHEARLRGLGYVGWDT